MATIHEVKQPDGHTYRFRRSDQDKMKLDRSGMSPEQIELVKQIEAGLTITLSKRQPDQHRPLPGGDTGRLRSLLRFFGLDGWG